MTQSRKLDKFKGRPKTPSDPGVDEWIEDAMAACKRKGLSTGDQAAYLIEHLGGMPGGNFLGEERK